ncbi:MAG TPA: ATP citrate lyase citrate-binding domain-containing protein [Candidatus Paceibacterota bacterium]
MARVKLSEYKAKQLLLGSEYRGVQLRSGEKMEIPKGKWVAKVDQGVKKRMKQGLVAVNKPRTELQAKIREWEKKGFSQFVLEPYLAHEPSEEQYFSLERVREGIRMLHAREGGIDIEAHPEAVQTYIVHSLTDAAKIAQRSGLPEAFLRAMLEAFERNFFAFLEINPLVIRGSEAHLLDAAVLVDSAGEFFVGTSDRPGWTERDVVKTKMSHRAEEAVASLASTTPASLKLTVLNQNGSLFLLLSGGGGSIVIADEAKLLGAGAELGNYGEYSGGPSREETYLYAKEVIKLMLDAKPGSAQGGSASGRRALVIAGGIANFTDVRSTFLGIIDALAGVAATMRMHGVKVFVRRGGPNEREGLALMRDFLEKEGLFGTVHGSDSEITSAMREAVTFVRV